MGTRLARGLITAGAAGLPFMAACGGTRTALPAPAAGAKAYRSAAEANAYRLGIAATTNRGVSP
jgi:hypothetical protein